LTPFRQAAPSTAQATPPTGQGPRVPVLERPQNTVPPDTAYTPPESIGRRPAVDPAHREPLALATRKGLGFGMQTALPSSELVHQQIRGEIERQHNTLSNGAKADWSQADLDLATWVSRPALEADLPAVMSGIDRTITVGGRPYTISVRAHLTDRIGGDTYEMTVNGRAMMATGSSGHRGTEIGVQASGGGGVRFGRYPYMRFILGSWNLGGEIAYGKKNEFGGRRSPTGAPRRPRTWTSTATTSSTR
jgi:hypothetical protein